MFIDGVKTEKEKGHNVQLVLHQEINHVELNDGPGMIANPETKLVTERLSVTFTNLRSPDGISYMRLVF